jgi:hypothetical protein
VVISQSTRPSRRRTRAARGQFARLVAIQLGIFVDMHQRRLGAVANSAVRRLDRCRSNDDVRVADTAIRSHDDALRVVASPDVGERGAGG